MKITANTPIKTGDKLGYAMFLLWNSKDGINPGNISFVLHQGSIPFHEKLIAESANKTSSASLPDDPDVISAVNHEISEDNGDKSLTISCKIIKESLFRKEIECEKSCRIIEHGEMLNYISANSAKRIYPVPNAMGLALSVITSDDKIIFIRRNEKAGVRPGEYDCSFVEKLSPAVSEQIGEDLVTYDITSPDYIQKECERAFRENICDDTNIYIHIMGLILDRDFGHWNLGGYIRTELTSDEIKSRVNSREDLTDRKLFFIPLHDDHGKINRSVVENVMEYYRYKSGFWDTAAGVTMGTLDALQG